MVWPTLGSRKAKEQNRTGKLPATNITGNLRTVVVNEL